MRQPPSSSRRERCGSLAFPLALLLALLLSLAGGAGIRAQNFEEAASVVVVEVPVQVVDENGEPVRGLKPENFVVTDGRQQQEIIDFDVIDRGTVVEAARAAVMPPAGRRHFLLLFDLSFSDPSSILAARQAARTVLDRMHPTDLVAVGTFTLLRGTELILRFTSDRKQAEVAIDTLGAPQAVDRSPDPLGLMIQGPQPAGGGMPFGAQSEAAGVRAGNAAAVEEFLREMADVSARTNRAAQENRVQGLVRSMADLAGLMRAVEGRKYVVYLSEGFDSTILTGEGGQDDERNRAIESGELWEVSTDEMFGSGRLQNSLEQMLEEFRRADCTIQAVDIGRLRGQSEGPSMAGGQDGLFAMAKGTGGELYRNFNDLGAAMGKMLERTSVTYVLAFQPEGLEADGEYHPIKVRLQGAPRGARLVHRPGYFAPQAGVEASAEEQKLQLASKLLSGETGGVLGVSVLAVPFKNPGAKAAVPVLIEVDGKRFAGPAATGSASAEIYAYALDAAGGVADYFFQTLDLDLGKVGPRLIAGGVKFYGRFDLDPGTYTVRVLVRNSTRNTTGVAAAALEVPGFEPGSLVVLPPLVPEMSLDKWLMVRQAPTPGEPEFAYPFTLGEGESFIPAAVPVVAGDKPVQIGVFAYEAGEGASLSAEIMNAQGDVVLGQQLPVVRRYEAAAGGPAHFLAALQVAGVPPGDYTLAVGIADGKSGRRDLATIPVRIEAGAPGAGGSTMVVEGLPPVEEPRGPSARDRERLPLLENTYHEVLAKLSSGFERDAAQALVAMEKAEARATDDLMLEVLHGAEMTVARQLARHAPDALIPVMLLHEASYLGYRGADERLLARHSRTMVQELAELYVEAGGTPTSVAANVFTSLGGSLQQAGLTSSANSLFLRALDLEKGNEGALLSLAVYSEKVSDYEQTVHYLEKLVELHPGNSEAWLRLGINLQRLGREDAAQRWLLRALSPEALEWVRALGYEELGAAALAAGDLQQAEKLLRQGLDQVPSDQRLYLLLANVLDRRGQIRAGLAALAGLQPAAEGAESPRLKYNRWPAAALERTRSELKNTASSRLSVLARVVSDLAKTEWAR